LADELVRLTEHRSISRETVRRRLAENQLKPWRQDMWCIPQVDGEYVARMEDVLDLYAEAPDPKRSVVCFDESPTQCKPPAGINDILSYQNPAGSTSGNDWGDWSLECGSGGWVLSDRCSTIAWVGIARCGPIAPIPTFARMATSTAATSRYGRTQAS
jgi:hypothetical protein